LTFVSSPIPYAEHVAARVRMEMRDQGKPISELAAILSLENVRDAAALHDGVVALSLSEVDLIAAWLEVPRTELLRRIFDGTDRAS